MEPIITLDEYKEYAGIKSPNQDDQLKYAVNYANSLVLAYCNTSFSPSSVSDKRVTVLPGELEVIIPNSPVLSVEEIAVLDGTVVLESLDLDECYLETEVGIVTLPASVYLPSKRFNLSLSYTYGYSEIPQDVALACLELVTHVSKREYIKSKSVDGQSANFSDPKILPTHIKTILDLYRVI